MRHRDYKGTSSTDTYKPEWYYHSKKQHEKDFLILSKFTRDILSILISIISSESAFSFFGRILDNRRMSLTPEMVKALTCLQDWELADWRQQVIIRHADDKSEHFTSLNINDELGPSNRWKYTYSM